LRSEALPPASGQAYCRCGCCRCGRCRCRACQNSPPSLDDPPADRHRQHALASACWQCNGISFGRLQLLYGPPPADINPQAVHASCVAVLLASRTTGSTSQTPPSAAEHRTALLSGTIVGQRHPVLRSFAETRAGKKLKKRLEEAEGIIASGSHSNNNDLRPHVQPAPPLPKGCIETGTADLHRDRSSQLEGGGVVPAQQCKGGSPDALLPAVYSPLPTTGRIAGNTAQNTNPSIPLSHPSTSIAVGMATPLAIECFPPNLYYANVGGSPFDEGYLAMNGHWAASHYQYM
jgi:hypothetical protein